MTIFPSIYPMATPRPIAKYQSGLSVVSDKLPRAALPTATLLLRLNDLVDVMNSSNRFNDCFNRRAISNIQPQTATQHLRTLREGEAWLKRWKVGDGAKIDSVGGLQQTIRGVIKLWERCQAVGCSFICTRRFNQDPLENLFGVVRQRGGCMDNPNPVQFRQLYKHALLNRLIAAPMAGNCADDGDTLLAALRRVAAEQQQAPAPSLPAPDPGSVPLPQLSKVQRNLLTYLSGYLIRQARVNCNRCRKLLNKQKTMALTDEEAFTALKSYTAVSEDDVGSLLRPTKRCSAFVKACYAVFTCHAEAMTMQSGICQRLVSCAMARREGRRLTSKMCHPAALRRMAATFMRMSLHRMCAELVSKKAKISGRTRTNATKKLKKLQAKPK